MYSSNYHLIVGWERHIMSGAADDVKSFEAFIVDRHRVEEEQNPDVSYVDDVVLKDGPRVYKYAAHFVIIDRHTKAMHHHAVKIETYRLARGSWIRDDVHTVTIDNDKEDQIKRLLTFLRAIERLPESDASYAIVPAAGDGLDHDAFIELLNKLSIGGVADVIAEALARAQGDAELLRAIVARAADNPDASKEAAAALTVARFTDAVAKLEHLIQTDAREAEFQALLEDNPWMFGSEYSELLDQRRWTRDEQQDFMLRRTADGYLEMIEIKTPLGGLPLFVRDPSHDTVFPRRELAMVLGQVTKYLEELDAARVNIEVRDKEKANKVRAKIIIGRSGDEEQAEALRRLNGHLHRIEILTFDQLLRIAKQVVSYLEQVIAPEVDAW